MNPKKVEAMWNSRYDDAAFAYGTAPNKFFKDTLDDLGIEGKALFVAEGEGRNAVYAAGKGLEVHAFDISESGKTKAENLARENEVKLNYEVGQFPELELAQNSFDLIVLIYAHLPPPVLEAYHKLCAQLLREGGYIILEGFSKANLERRLANPAVGGPDNIDMLFSADDIVVSFPGVESILAEEVIVDLREGLYHNGEASVVRYIGKKPLGLQSC